MDVAAARLTDPVMNLNDALNRERRRTHEARSLARELIALIANGEIGHPGEPCHRTHWIADRNISRWRSTTRAWLDDLDHSPTTTETTMRNLTAGDDIPPNAITSRLRLHAQVHYVAYGTPAGEYPSTCRAATVTQVGGWRTISDQRVTSAEQDAPLERTLHQVWDAEIAALHVTNPTGVFMHECPHDETTRLGGTWHWPDNCDH